MNKHEQTYKGCSGSSDKSDRCLKSKYLRGAFKKSNNMYRSRLKHKLIANLVAWNFGYEHFAIKINLHGKDLVVVFTKFTGNWKDRNDIDISLSLQKKGRRYSGKMNVKISGDESNQFVFPLNFRIKKKNIIFKHFSTGGP